MTEGTGKPCPKCTYPLVGRSSQQKRLCGGCGSEWPWELKEGQKPLVGSSRQGRTK